MITIRRATPDDAIVAEFYHAMALRTENRKLGDENIQLGVTRMIRDENLGFYLTGNFSNGTNTVNGHIAGCLAITTEWSDWRNGLFWWIQSVYVSLQFRRMGVFASLYQAGKCLAQEQTDVCGIHLYADRENDPAMRTHLRLGTIETDYRLLEEEF